MNSTFDAFVEGTYSLSILFKDASEMNDCRLEPLPEEWDFDYLCEHGEWKEDTAGGCLDFATWFVPFFMKSLFFFL